MSAGNVAVVLKVGDRFFVGVSKSNRLQTAWSLAGARLFSTWQESDVEKAEALVSSRGRKCVRVRVGLLADDDGPAFEQREQAPPLEPVFRCDSTSEYGNGSDDRPVPF